MYILYGIRVSLRLTHFIFKIIITINLAAATSLISFSVVQKT